jgi:type II restriction enzyme
MLYDRSSAREKWTIMMYMRDFDLMVAYAYALRASNNLSTDNIDDILAKMEEDGIYRPRYGGSTFTGQFKSIQIAWYMFGYYNKSRRAGEEKKLVFSPLGNLLLDNTKDKHKVSLIFLTMLYGNGFHQPFSQMDERFNIFAYRLIFKLLRDPRLGGKLFNDEVFYLAMFLKTVDEETYEELVTDILQLRTRSPFDKLIEFKENERVIGLACHEWRYATGMLESAGLVTVHNDNDNRTIGTLTYGNISEATGRPNAVRKYTEDYIVLKPEFEAYVNRLLAAYPVFDKPYPEEELTTKFNNAMVVEMYSFYPKELLEELGMDTETDKAIATMLNIASSINYYSREETDTGVKFEYALADAFNLFIDVDAERIGGAGNADIECLYYLPSDGQKKFDIEAKSTSRKLMQINSRRLKTHRIRIGSKYTIIVTPNYSIGVLRDIEGEDSVIVKSATLANYLYQYILHNGRNISYATLDEIVENCYGSDITERVNAHVYSNFGHGANDFRV